MTLGTEKPRRFAAYALGMSLIGAAAGTPLLALFAR